LHARVDLLDAAEQLASIFSELVANDFLQKVDRTIEFIARFPEASALYLPNSKKWSNLRARAIIGFGGRVLYYRIIGDSIVIQRVLQAGQNYSDW
jgi:plasmid stabilization system protein ParE